MDDKANNFEQQFMQNVKTTAPSDVPTSEKPKHTNLIIMTILIIVMVFQTVFSIVTLIKFYSVLNEASVINTEETTTTDFETAYRFGEGGSLEAISAECKSENGSTYTLTLDNKYKEQDSSSRVIDSGAYSIDQDIAFRLDGTAGQKTLYYGDYILTDGTSFYTCSEILVKE